MQLDPQNERQPQLPRHTKILATVGPASSKPEVLEKLVELGVNGFRLNFSHGSHDVHREVVKNIRALEEKHHRPITILQDLQGPKIRLGQFADGAKHVLEVGQTFTLDNDKTPGTAQRVQLPHPEILEVLNEGDPVYVNDGVVKMRVTAKKDGAVECVVEASGPVSDRKGVNLPGVDLPFSAMTDKDREDAKFGQELGVDWVALSFVQRAEDVQELRDLIGPRSRIMAKMEMPNAIKRIDSIIDLCDGMMVARGDLGVEMPLEEVPPIQKRIIRRCREEGKVVVVATQMLESMTQNNTPTRAEVSDVANAAYEGADCLMLSAETAAGDYPVEAVEVMSRVIKRVEISPAWKPLMDARHPESVQNIGDAITLGAHRMSQQLDISAIVTFTSSGSTAMRMSRQRPLHPIMVLTPEKLIARQLNLGWGLQPHVARDVRDFEDLVPLASQAMIERGLGAKGCNILITAGVPFGVSGSTNMVRVVTL